MCAAQDDGRCSHERVAAVMPLNPLSLVTAAVAGTGPGGIGGSSRRHPGGQPAARPGAMEQKQPLMGASASAHDRRGSGTYGTARKSPKLESVVRHELTADDRLESLALLYDVSVGAALFIFKCWGEGECWVAAPVVPAAAAIVVQAKSQGEGSSWRGGLGGDAAARIVAWSAANR